MTGKSHADGDEFDYVVVGAGSSGCTVAARLVESGRNKVLLIEAGKRDTNPWIHIPVGYGKHFSNPDVNWLYKSEPGEKWIRRPVAQPRGKVLGGTSSINGSVYIRGQKEDYDHWRQLGNPGWAYEDVLPYFRKSEDQQHGENAFHGSGGPLAVCDPWDTHPLCDAFIDGAESLGYKRNNDFNGSSQEGFGYYQWTIRNGRRCSAASGYLRNLPNRENLRTEVETHATRIIFEGRRAIGVACQRAGEDVSYYARTEVIVSAGAINSPQLLQLSGLGPSSLLQKFDIDVIADLPGVGMNLQDHINGPLMYRLNENFTGNDMVNSIFHRLKEGLQYFILRKGLMCMGSGYSGGFLRADPTSATPDIQALLLLFSSEDPGSPAHSFPGCTIVATLMRPESRGYVKIKSPDPFDAPAIQPNYLSDRKDRDTLVAGFKQVRKIAETDTFGRYVVSEVEPGTECLTDDEVLDYICKRGRSSYHLAGSCAMGNSPEAVVDERLRVRGFENLRVVDASIMPALTSGNTNAPSIMIGEKAADMIMEDAGRS